MVIDKVQNNEENVWFNNAWKVLLSNRKENFFEAKNLKVKLPTTSHIGGLGFNMEMPHNY